MMVAAFSYEGSAMADCIYGAMDNTTSGIIQTDTITGTGLLYVNTAMPATGYSTWADTNAGSQPADAAFDLDDESVLVWDLRLEKGDTPHRTVTPQLPVAVKPGGAQAR